MSQEQRDQLAAELAQPNRLSFSKLAEKYGTSASLIQRLNVQVDPVSTHDVSDVDSAATELERRTGERLPPDRLVRALERLVANPKTPPSVRLAAIGMAVELRGVVTRKQRKDAELTQPGAGPVFAFNIFPSAAPQAVVVQPVDNAQVSTPALPDPSKSST